MNVPWTGERGISVVMSAYNEAAVIRDCLESVTAWAAEIVVVDCSSRDRTAAIAAEYTDRVITTTNKLMFNVNKNLAIDAATREWVLLLDPDERVTPELAGELQRISAQEDSPFAGYWMPRRNFELGRWIDAMGPDRQLRFFRNGAARFPCRHMHEMVQVDGAVGELSAPLLHFPRQELFAYVHKRNVNSEHRAVYLFEQGVPFRLRNLLFRPLLAFARQYLLKGGWREGVPGLIIAVSGAYATFLQDAKLWQKWEHRRRGLALAPASEVLTLGMEPGTEAP